MPSRKPPGFVQFQGGAGGESRVSPTGKFGYQLRLLPLVPVPLARVRAGVFWPAVRERLPDGEKLAAHGIDQEHAAEQLFARLYSENAPSESRADYDELVSDLVSALRKHLAFEDKVLSHTYDALSEQERVELGRRFKAARQTNEDARSKPPGFCTRSITSARA